MREEWIHACWEKRMDMCVTHRAGVFSVCMVCSEGQNNVSEVTCLHYSGYQPLYGQLEQICLDF